MKSKNFHTSYNLLANSINQVIQYFLTKLFHFSYEILNAPSEKSTFFFQCCFMSEKQILMSFRFFFFLGIISQKGDLLFNGEASFLSGGVTHGGGIGFHGGGGSKKSWDGGGAPHAPTPTHTPTPQWETLPIFLSIY